MLGDLIEKLEQATAGSPELDRLIFELFEETPPDQTCPPPITTSIDEALAFAEKILPGCYYQLMKSNPFEIAQGWSPFWASVGPFGHQEIAQSSSPAIAICIAVLLNKEVSA